MVLIEQLLSRNSWGQIIASDKYDYGVHRTPAKNYRLIGYEIPAAIFYFFFYTSLIFVWIVHKRGLRIARLHRQNDAQ